ncbi:MAG: hypothetical protein MR868_02475 [Lachnospiraceae bacterium]|nr:hypothetical protein [Lachnospiraceae bacterium]
MTAVLIILALAGIFFFCYHMIGNLDHFLKSSRKPMTSTEKSDRFQDDEAVLYQTAFDSIMNQKN